MSNLNLPSLSRSALVRSLKDGKRVKLAFATHAHRSGETVTIEHHDTVIAVLSPEGVRVTNAGWGSSTTRARLHAVLSDNGTGYGVTQRDFSQCLTHRATGERLAGFVSAEIDTTGDAPRLSFFNGSAV